MRRRELLGYLGAGPLALTAAAPPAADDGQPMQGRADNASKDPKTSCYEQCESVAELCTLTADQCLADLRAGRGENGALATVHWVLADCREFARLNAANILRGSWFIKS